METRKKENREEAVADLALDGFRVHYSEGRFWRKVGSLPRETGRALLVIGRGAVPRLRRCMRQGMFRAGVQLG
jgi:hypothetical protein